MPMGKGQKDATPWQYGSNRIQDHGAHGPERGFPVGFCRSEHLVSKEQSNGTGISQHGIRAASFFEQPFSSLQPDLPPRDVR